MSKRQARIPGTEPKRIKEVGDAAEAYVDMRDKRMKLTEKESEAKLSLIEVMKKHGLTVYKDEDAAPPLVVTLKTKDGVKVEELGDGAESDDDSEAA
jgi:hypothetical protein